MTPENTDTPQTADGPSATCPAILSKDEFLAQDARYQKACARRDAAEAAIGGAGRWGECRRFAGAHAGNRLDKAERARAAWSRAYDAAERRWQKWAEQPLSDPSAMTADRPLESPMEIAAD